MGAQEAISARVSFLNDIMRVVRSVQPVRIYVCAAREDQAFVHRLELHLKPQVRAGRISLWHDEKIAPGTESKAEIYRQLDDSQVFVPLLSADYLASDELDELSQRAIEREAIGELSIVPVLARACDFKAFRFSSASVLRASGGLPIGAPGDDSAWLTIVAQLNEKISSLFEAEHTSPDGTPPVSDRLGSHSDPAQEASFTLAERDGSESVGVHHLLGGLFFWEDGIAQAILAENGLSWEVFRTIAGSPRWPESAGPSPKHSRTTPTLGAEAQQVIALAGEMRRRSGDDNPRSRDLLAAALTLRGVPAVNTLLSRGLLGDQISEIGLTRFFVKVVRRPWQLPVEAFTIPTGPGTSPSGGLWGALRDSLDEERTILVEAVRDAMHAGVQPDRPARLLVPGSLRRRIIPSFAFMATAGSELKGAAQAAETILRQARASKIQSIAISLLGSGAGGLETGDVVDAMLPALLKGAGRAGPAIVVLTTLASSAVRRAHRLGEILGPQPAPIKAPAVLRAGAAPQRAAAAEDTEASTRGPQPDKEAETEPTEAPSMLDEASRPAFFSSGPIDTTSPPLPELNPPLPERIATSLRLVIHHDKAELLSITGSVWSREGMPSWASASVDVDGAPVPLSDALPQLDQWSLEQTVAFGDRLAELLFDGAAPDEVRRTLAVPSGATLRLVLDLDPAAAVVPWEYLRLAGSFLIEQRVSMLRHVTAEAPPRPLRLAKMPQSVLFAWASPLDADDDFVRERHVERTEAALRQVADVMRPVSRCSPAVLRTELQRSTIEAVHYLGHGEIRLGSAGHLVVHSDPNSSAKTAEIEAHQLATWIGNTSSKLVFLGACHSGAVPPRAELTSLAGEIARRTGIPVVAMQVAVPRAFATTFADAFYRHLRDGQDIERAVYLARQVEHEGRHAFGIPVLYADERATEEQLELPTPPSRGWAHFTVTPAHTASPDRARATWSEVALPPEARSRVTRALDAMTQAGARAIPVPRADEEDLVRDAIRELFRSQKVLGAEDLAAALTAHRTFARPRAVVPVVVHGAVEVLDDRNLTVSFLDVKPKLAEIGKQFALSEDLLLRAVSELAAGRHVLFVGPVGTGKTTLAIQICRALDREPFAVTASADWTAFDVVGGFFPRMMESKDGARTEMEFRPGAFTEAVLANWQEAPAASGRSAFRRGPGGTWLVLDEMNRADVDRALGPVFTALETKKLRVPTASFARGEPTTVELPVPDDFRVLATLNGVDRHYLFRLSDALKRRFAFIEVPVTWELAHEWATITRRCDGGLDASTPAGDLRRFVYLTRAFHPIGTAQLFAGAKFLSASALSGLSDEARLTQAIRGSVLPGLEDAPPPLLRLLKEWAIADTPRFAVTIRSAIERPGGAPAALEGELLTDLLDALGQVTDGLVPAGTGAPGTSWENVAQKLARNCAPLIALGRTLDGMGRANEGSRVGV